MARLRRLFTDRVTLVFLFILWMFACYLWDDFLAIAAHWGARLFPSLYYKGEALYFVLSSTWGFVALRALVLRHARH
ncbi:unnamed protein product, partial [Mesorhabditis belari]|uniref:Uncharacterized protein n=1 Tax=Mesorhabditis belari TaxID=2138241 RepID=A0AAF3J8X4_9BILA